jgi:hypothetical protein
MVWQVGTNVSKEPPASIFRMNGCPEEGSRRYLRIVGAYLTKLRCHIPGDNNLIALKTSDLKD